MFFWGLLFYLVLFCFCTFLLITTFIIHLFFSFGNYRKAYYVKKLAFFYFLCYTVVMKKNKQENAQPTSVFKIKFSATIYALSVAIYLLCAVGIAISIWRIYNFGVRSFSSKELVFFIIIIS